MHPFAGIWQAVTLADPPSSGGLYDNATLVGLLTIVIALAAYTSVIAMSLRGKIGALTADEGATKRHAHQENLFFLLLADAIAVFLGLVIALRLAFAHFQIEGAYTVLGVVVGGVILVVPMIVVGRCSRKLLSDVSGKLRADWLTLGGLALAMIVMGWLALRGAPPEWIGEALIAWDIAITPRSSASCSISCCSTLGNGRSDGEEVEQACGQGRDRMNPPWHESNLQAGKCRSPDRHWSASALAFF